VRVPRGLKHVRAWVGGRRARMVKRHGKRVVIVRPRAHTAAVTVRFRGTDRHGRHVTKKHRYRFCR